jgi:replicative DNA helicase
MNVPYSKDAEQSVVGQMLRNPKTVGLVVGTLLEPQHFHLPAMRRIFHEVVSNYYADEPTDALTIGEACAKDLARSWSCDEPTAVQHVQALSRRKYDGSAVDHAKIVKRDADQRALLILSDTIKQAVEADDGPDEIAGMAAQTAMQIATNSLHTHEIVSFADLGREFVRNQKMLMEARRQGIELGAYFGLSFLDSFMRGLRPTELFFLAGEPGAGKSAVAWKAVQMFAERQMRKVPEQRVGTLVLSLEMGIEPSNVRVAGSISGVDGGAMREGRTTDDDLAKIISEWTKRKDIPLFFNFTSQLKVSQARALIVEAIRRHNVGLVVIDHFKYVLSDQRHQNALEEDEEKARFLKEAIAKELNVAVICLAHTTKLSSEDGRPRLRDLRGSYMVAAHADFVGFVYRPYEYAKQQDIDEGKVQRTDAELIWDKNRHGLEGAARFYFDPSTMNVH